jgi:hypothetical protein
MGYEDQAAHESGDREGAILCRTGRGDETRINPAVALYVWGSNGVLRAARDAINEIDYVRPDAACLHGGTGDLLANLPAALTALRVAIDRHDLRVWVGVGIDGTIEAWQQGRLTSEQVIARHVAVAKMIAGLCVEVVVPNGEGKWALIEGSKRTLADVRALADAIARAYCEHAPDCVLALSSFGRLGYHANVRALIEGFTARCSVFTGQSYAARPGPVKPGILPAVLEADEKSQRATVRQRWMRDDAPGDADSGDTADDLDRVPTVQAHKTHPPDLERGCIRLPHVAVWSVPTIAEGGRADQEGLDALRVACAIRRYGGCGPGAVRHYQSEHGLKADGILGPVTRAHALGVP